MASRWEPPFWIGERMFTDGDLDLIRETVERFSSLSRTELALTLCENLPWQAPNGQARLHSCLSLLEEMDADGLVKIPAKRGLAPYRPARLHTQP
ncbi:MAG TPA: hypothetical protein DEH07_07960, partial [Desulfotomaculum sp.]|nr:hypothetical protein [Desulfotomaculum sp.]